MLLNMVPTVLDCVNIQVVIASRRRVAGRRRHVHRQPDDRWQGGSPGFKSLTRSLTGSGVLGPSTFIFKNHSVKWLLRSSSSLNQLLVSCNWKFRETNYERLITVHVCPGWSLSSSCCCGGKPVASREIDFSDYTRNAKGSRLTFYP